MTIVVKTLTLDTLETDTRRYQAVCQDCHWLTIWALHQDSVEGFGADHVRDTGHTVNIEDRGVEPKKCA